LVWKSLWYLLTGGNKPADPFSAPVWYQYLNRGFKHSKQPNTAMKIIERKISELKPAEYNPRQLTDKQYKDIKESLERFGFVDPVIVNTT
jgi:hypothetical protein